MQRRQARELAVARSHQDTTNQTLRAALSALALCAALAWLLAGGPAFGQAIENLGEFGNWRAFAFDENGEKACYIASQPTKDEGKYTQRGKIYAMVTHRPAEKVRDEVSLAAGYTFKPESSVQVTIDSTKFQLFPHEDTAWAPDTAGDQKLVAAMKAGSTMVVQGTSKRGTATKDTYSLSGFTKAYTAAAKACGY